MKMNVSFISYIVRIYRFKKNNPWSLVGIVKEVGTNSKKAFTGCNELWDILNSPQGINPSGKSGRRKGLKKNDFVTQEEGET